MAERKRVCSPGAQALLRMGLRACVHRWARARRHANVMRARTLLWAVRGWVGRAEAYREACVASVPRGERSLKQVHACCMCV